MTDLPDPPVPAGADLRSVPKFPMDPFALRRSKFWIGCKDHPGLAFYAMNLWMAAWFSVPAGSLEDDDVILAELAMCSADRWTTIKRQVMHGWRMHSDGRLYHSGIAVRVIEALDEMKAAQDQQKKAARKTAKASASSKRCPADFAVTDEMKAWSVANAPGVDIKAETAKFKDWQFHTARHDWLATWRNWMREASSRIKRDAARSGAKSESDIFAGAR